MARKTTDQVTTIGIDIGKNNFHVIGLDGAGNIVLRRTLMGWTAPERHLCARLVVR